MFIKDDDDAKDFHFKIGKTKPVQNDDGSDTNGDESRVNLRKSDREPIDLDELLKGADSEARSQEGGEITI
jgi:hypothetical protein